MKGKAFLLIVFALSSSSVYAETWVKVENYPIAYDKDSLVRDGDVVRYWLKGLGSGDVQNMWPREMDCKNRIDKTLGHFWIHRDGRRRESGHHRSTERISPGSDLEALHSEICPKAWQFWKR